MLHTQHQNPQATRRTHTAAAAATLTPPPSPQADLPVDVLRLLLQAVLGEGQQDAFTLVRQLQNFSLVCKTWREAAHTTALSINTDYLPVRRRSPAVSTGNNALYSSVHGFIVARANCA